MTLSHPDTLKAVLHQFSQAAEPGARLRPFLNAAAKALRDQWPTITRADIILPSDPTDDSLVAQALTGQTATLPGSRAIPLVSGETVLGVLHVDLASETEGLGETLAALAAPLSLAIEHLQTTPLTRALTLAQQIAAVHRIQDMVGILAEYLGADRCSLIDITLYEYDGDRPIRARAVVLSMAHASELTDFSTDIADYPLNAALPTLAQGEPIRIDDVYHTPLIDPGKHDYFRAQGITQITLIPLMAEERVIGAIAAAGEPVTPHELQGLQILAHQIAITIQHRDLLDRTSHALEDVQQLYRFGSAILNAHDPASLIQAVFAQFGTPPDELSLTAVSEGMPPKFTLEAGITSRGAATDTPLDPALDSVRTLAQGQPVLVNNIKADPAHAQSAAQHLQAIGMFPILLDGTLTHVLTAAYRSPHIYTAGEIQLLRQLAEQIGLQVSNWRLLRQTQEQTDRLARQVGLLESLYETGQQVSAGLASTSTLKTTCQHLADTLKLDFVAVTQADGTIRAAFPDTAGILAPPDADSASTVVHPADLPGTAAEFLAKRAIQTLVVAPLLSQGDNLGQLVLATADPDRSFGPEDTRVAQTLATQIATSLRNAELFTEVQHRANQLERIAAFGRLVTSTFSWEKILRHVTDVIPNLLVADQVSLALYTPGNSQLHLIILSQNAPPQESYLPIAGTSIETVLSTQTALFINDLHSSTYTDHRQMVREGLSSALIAPLIASGDAVGTVNVGHQRGQMYTPTDLTLLQQVANQIAIALENAHRFQITEQRAKYEESLNDIASRLQQQADLRDLLRQTMQGLGEALGAQRARVRLQSPSDLKPRTEK